MRKCQDKTFFIINPKSGSGKGKRLWRRAKRLIPEHFSDFEWSFTEYSRHAVKLAAEALEDGYQKIIAVGGDGTISEVVNGFFDEKQVCIAPKAAFGILNAGTGGDFIRNLNYPERLIEQIKRLKSPKTRKIDVLHAQYVDLNGEQAQRISLNISGCGVEGIQIQEMERFSKFLPGKIAHYLAILSSFIKYEFQEIDIKIDGKEIEVGETLLMVIANGRCFGKGLQIAPKAKIDDGFLDILLLDKVSILDLILSTPKMYAGQHLDHPKVRYEQAREIEFFTQGEVLLDIDGDVAGRLPARFEILPQALAMIV